MLLPAVLSALVMAPGAGAATSQPDPGDRAAASTLPTGDSAAVRQAAHDWTVPAARDDAAGEPAPEAMTPGRVLLLASPLTLGARVSSVFGTRRDPLDAATRLHPGIDLPASPGAPVRASAGGAVVRAGWAGGYGNMVEIDHGGGLHTRYGHLSRLLVGAGQPVRPGEIVGLIGSTGHSTGPHLHYEVRIDGIAINPSLGRTPMPLESPPMAPYSPDPATVTARWKGFGQGVAGDPTLPVSVLP